MASTLFQLRLHWEGSQRILPIVTAHPEKANVPAKAAISHMFREPRAGEGVWGIYFPVFLPAGLWDGSFPILDSWQVALSFCHSSLVPQAQSFSQTPITLIMKKKKKPSNSNRGTFCKTLTRTLNHRCHQKHGKSEKLWRPKGTIGDMTTECTIIS